MVHLALPRIVLIGLDVVCAIVHPPVPRRLPWIYIYVNRYFIFPSREMGHPHAPLFFLFLSRLVEEVTNLPISLTVFCLSVCQLFWACKSRSFSIEIYLSNLIHHKILRKP